MGSIMLVTGGSRSGKSDYALRYAETMKERRAFVATCPPLDDEMRHRIRKHQESRSPEMWETVEEPLELARAIESSGHCNVILVDCITLWVNNLMYGAELAGATVSEEQIVERCAQVLHACTRIESHVILVTNEVGMGVVPDNPSARRYRDLVGRCNQTIAAAANRVVLVSCGIPLMLKDNGSNECVS